MFVGFLAVLITVVMLLSNILFDKNFSYIAIGLGSISGSMLLVLLSTKKDVKNN
ncbi:hypothetical protein [Tepidibacter mesophilus]|uniref:hypothetical protein n=1 Tax=Tepidibacter mesophilus TaxID=655607 RepID=UPI0016510E58|nr:hypothetical protein [Tepidibacter mesophilus]